ncbi:hypothetical protein D3C78_1320420 [compost metagenome]
MRLLQLAVEVMHHHAVAHRQRSGLGGQNLKQVTAVIAEAHLRQRVFEGVGQALLLEIGRRVEQVEEAQQLPTDKPQARNGLPLQEQALGPLGMLAAFCRMAEDLDHHLGLAEHAMQQDGVAQAGQLAARQYPAVAPAGAGETLLLQLELLGLAHRLDQRVHRIAQNRVPGQRNGEQALHRLGQGQALLNSHRPSPAGRRHPALRAGKGSGWR